MRLLSVFMGMISTPLSAATRVHLRTKARSKEHFENVLGLIKALVEMVLIVLFKFGFSSVDIIVLAFFFVI